MTAALGLYSFAFTLISAVSLRSGDGPSYTYLVEPACIVVLAAVFVLAAVLTRRVDALYPTYRAVAPLMGLGFALLAFGTPPAVACIFVALGYLAFEVLALNDYCRLVQADDSSLFGTMAFARLAISVGMAAGWLPGYGAYLVVPEGSYVPVMATAALFVVLLVGTLAFTDRDVATMSTLADDRAVVEKAAPLLGKDEALGLFSSEAGLSKREAEVLGWLGRGARRRISRPSCLWPSPPFGRMSTASIARPASGRAWSCSTPSRSAGRRGRRAKRWRGARGAGRRGARSPARAAPRPRTFSAPARSPHTPVRTPAVSCTIPSCTIRPHAMRGRPPWMAPPGRTASFAPPAVSVRPSRQEGPPCSSATSSWCTARASTTSASAPSCTGPCPTWCPPRPSSRCTRWGSPRCASTWSATACAARIYNLASMMLHKKNFDVEKNLAPAGLAPVRHRPALDASLPRLHRGGEDPQAPAPARAHLVRRAIVDLLPRGPDQVRLHRLRVPRRLHRGAQRMLVRARGARPPSRTRRWATCRTSPTSPGRTPRAPSTSTRCRGCPTTWTPSPRLRLPHEGRAAPPRHDQLPAHEGVAFAIPCTASLTCRGCARNCATCGGSAYAFKNHFGRRRVAWRDPKLLIRDIENVQNHVWGPIFVLNDFLQAGEDYTHEFITGLKGKVRATPSASSSSARRRGATSSTSCSTTTWANWSVEIIGREPRRRRAQGVRQGPLHAWPSWRRPSSTRCRIPTASGSTCTS